MVVALPRWCSGNLLAAIDINTILSIPKIISKKVKVNNAIIASLVRKKSSILIYFYGFSFFNNLFLIRLIDC